MSTTDNDADLERILHIARNGLENSREDGDEQEELRLDTFAIVCVWAWKDEDGDECEGYSVYSESRRNHVQTGILRGGLSRLDEGIQK
jgi:hypothetical protein